MKSLTNVNSPKVDIIATVAHRTTVTLSPQNGKTLGKIIDEMVEEERLRNELDELIELTIRMPK